MYTWILLILSTLNSIYSWIQGSNILPDASCHGVAIVTSFCAIVMSDLYHSRMHAELHFCETIVQVVITIVAPWQEVYMTIGPLEGILVQRMIENIANVKPSSNFPPLYL